MPRRLLIQKIKEVFHLAKREPHVAQIMNLPFTIRISLGILLTCIGILGILTPIPFGAIFLTVGISLFVGLKRAKSLVIRFIHFTRLHLLYGKVYLWWKRGK